MSRGNSGARTAARKSDNHSEKSKSLTDRAYDQLRQEIITCKLPPGTDLGEQELAEKLDMSKTPVREALARLTLEGLVEAFPRRGYRITAVTVKSVNDVFTVRKAIEGVAGELAAERLSAEELDHVEALSNARYVPGEQPTIEAFIKQNNDFHVAIAEGAQVPRLTMLIRSYLEESTRLFHMGAAVRDVNPETTTDHARIVAALRRRDGDAAREAIIQHTENTRLGLLKSLISDRNSLLVL
ncbi:GntR family transcriptional regulator [Martelella radicis]|uniref:DNA-binding GntR family transcriptional regulator n=1 Tax=Martelella radicis TaxID=1397476 RepID=A0A7W6KM02_9HYPH|nr:GntR family transcriptional regulator [Martelella radicis]MBB4122584.1 DNA-binding GntR family transcriptional regulator [Martelella radicis]